MQSMNQATPPLQETPTRIGVAVQYAVENDTGEGGHQPDGMPHRVDRRVDVQVVETHAAVRAAVDGEAATEPVGLLVDWPILLGAQVVRKSARREHRPRHPELLHRPAQL